MKIINLAKDGALKIRRSEYDLNFKDIEDRPSTIPGEWAIFFNTKDFCKYLGYFFEKGIKIVDEVFDVDISSSEEKFAKEKIFYLLERALEKRKKFSDLDSGSRLIFGPSDNLPGLIVDEYRNAILIMISTMGIARFKDDIKQKIESFFNKKSYFFYPDSAFDSLPKFEDEQFTSDLSIIEDGFQLVVENKSLQKLGYYYDHRLNRKKMELLIDSLRIKKEKGLDLFSYVGTWGLHLLRAKVESVDFVDQGDFESNIDKNLKLNFFDGKGQFYRKDVFDFIDEAIERNISYNIICSDPPSFAKNYKNKDKALDGYTKLHTKIMQILSKDSLFIAASCTHYVSFDDFMKTITEAANRAKRKITLVDIGIQGPDHPFTSFSDRSCYIKYLAYLVE